MYIHTYALCVIVFYLKMDNQSETSCMLPRRWLFHLINKEQKAMFWEHYNISNGCGSDLHYHFLHA